MVTMQYQSTSHTTMLTHRQCFANSITAARTILRRELRRHFPYSPTGACSLVGEYLDEGSPTRVAYTFGKVMVFHHAANVQIFNRYLVIVADDFKSRLVVKILALIRYLLMLAREQRNRLASATAPLVASAYLALRGLQSLLCNAQVLWVFYHFAVAQSRKVLDANIDPASIAGLWDESALAFFDSKDRVPTISLAFDRAGFNLAFNRAMLDDFDLADFRQVKPFAFDLKGAFGLRKGETVKPCASLESWITRLVTGFHSAKESVKGPTQSAQGVLQDLGIDPCDVGPQFFDLWELKALLMEVDGLTANRVSVAAFLQPGVVKFPAAIKPLLKYTGDARRRFQLESVSFHRESLFYTAF